MVGGGATHAWCAVYLPGAGWVEFDPTNGLIAGRNLIRVCVARTPEQAIPVAGGFIGTTADTAGLTVDVQVIVGDADRERPDPDPPPHTDPAAAETAAGDAPVVGGGTAETPPELAAAGLP